jgi:hypothetical protein
VALIEMNQHGAREAANMPLRKTNARVAETTRIGCRVHA